MLKKSHGFSMLELMIVMAIVGIGTIIAMSEFGGTSRTRLKTVASDIASYMQIAKIKAFEQGVPWAVQFDTTAKKFTVGPLTAGPDGILYTNDDVLSATNMTTTNLSLYTGISFGSTQGKRTGDNTSTATDVTFDNNRVIFRSDGTSTLGTVYLKNSKGDNIAVGTLTAGGMIRVWRNFGAGWEG